MTASNARYSAPVSASVSASRPAQARRLGRRALPHFDAYSVLLFALFTAAGLGATMPRAHAQASMGPGGNTTAPASQSAPAISPRATAPAATGTIEAAFARADANADGQLSREEAGRYPSVAQQFERMDTDRSGSLSEAEFVTAVRAGNPPPAPASSGG